jgi:hypothetical protein
VSLRQNTEEKKQGQEPIHLVTYVNEEEGDGEGAASVSSSLLSYTLRYVSLTEFDNVCQEGL